MIPPNQTNYRPGPGESCSEPNRKGGSVKRARQLLEVGVRPTQGSRPALRPPPSSPRSATSQTQWPLPASGLQPQPLNPNHSRFMAPRGPPPLRPPRPSEVPSQIPSPSVYSIRSGESSESTLPLNYTHPYPYPMRPTRSFSHPTPRLNQQPIPGSLASNNDAGSPTGSVDMTPRISIETDDLFRHSTHSASSSIPYTHPAPPAEPPMPQSRRQAAGLIIPSNVRRSRVRRSSVSPIPEEIPDPRLTLGSYASSRAIPSSWGSGPAESEILGAYLDDESSDDEDKIHHRPQEMNPVRSASLGKRHKPTMRTILKSNPSSEISMPEIHDTSPSPTRPEPVFDVDEIATTGVTAGTAAKEGDFSAQDEGRAPIRIPTSVRQGSLSSLSGESWADLEKPRLSKEDEQNTYRGALEKQLETLPKAAPTMSDKRPNGRKPPRLDMDAVRGAEARGSLSSLTDLIRRATKLASNLDHGRTASRADLASAGAGADFMDPGRGRNPGSLSDILASFPNPSVITPDTRGSWPVFFGRSQLRNAEPLASHDDVPQGPNPRHRCCGMPRKWFILLCILIFVVVVLAVLLPVFLVAIPRERAHNDSCSQTTPCKNGGVSVSSGTECSCVCIDGFTGAQCTTVGDSSCVTSEVNNGSIDKNATMGSSIPTLLEQSSSKFGIELDAVTIMALFSMNNVSCQTENVLVSFSEVDHSRKSRRFIDRPIEANIDSLVEIQTKTTVQPTSTSSSTFQLEATRTNNRPVSHVVEERSLATSNGIYYDSDSTTSSSSGSGARDSEVSSSETSTTATVTPTVSTASTAASTAVTTIATSTSSSAALTSEVLEFSRVAVLYILEKTGSFDSAQESETQIQTYLMNSYQSADHPVVTVLGWYTLSFENRTITTG